MPRLLVLLLLGMAQAEPGWLVAWPDYAPFTDPPLPGGVASGGSGRVLDKAGLPWQLEWRPWANGYSATYMVPISPPFPISAHPSGANYLPIQIRCLLEIRAFALPGSKLDGAHPTAWWEKRYCHPIGWGVFK